MRRKAELVNWCDERLNGNARNLRDFRSQPPSFPYFRRTSQLCFQKLKTDQGNILSCFTVFLGPLDPK